MTGIVDVKKKIREILLADASIKALVAERVYLEWFERTYSLPCITVSDLTERGEVGELGGGFDEYGSLVQVDVWCRSDSSKSGPLNRDELAELVKVALGKKTNFSAMQAAGFLLGSPFVRALDELDLKPPIYRKSMQFPVTYWTGSYA